MQAYRRRLDSGVDGGHRIMKNGSLQVVSGSGHHIHLDRPEPIVAAVRSMVETFRLGRNAGGEVGDSGGEPAWSLGIEERRMAVAP